MNKTVTLLLSLTKKEDIPFIRGDCIGVDRGAFFALIHNIPLAFAVGDFDSITQEEKSALFDVYKNRWVELPKEKDQSDAEAAIRFAIEQGYTSIILLGGIHGRQDHFLSLLQLLHIFADYPIQIMDSQHLIRVLQPGLYELEKTHDYFSLFAIEEAMISIDDAKYPLKAKKIEPNNPLGLSNTWINHQSVRIHVQSGLVLLFLTKDEI